ncbi:hypothetical protein M7I_4293 [Glarea lozoyensis 74030]|uniref:Uncharacterized protein n=1 Tax=Glarea lozoyensis (strain ATCC 74030 / MF5533) TaxID=1104152 RepID=H0ENT0_GLAL7|nr:hypothetical protein M7I_4293 [Glarea lozoyensis 74030]
MAEISTPSRKRKEMSDDHIEPAVKRLKLQESNGNAANGTTESLELQPPTTTTEVAEIDEEDEFDAPARVIRQEAPPEGFDDLYLDTINRGYVGNTTKVAVQNLTPIFTL